MEVRMVDLPNNDTGLPIGPREESVSLTAEVIIGVGLVLAFVLALVLLHPAA
jgi:hypothetical protein